MLAEMVTLHIDAVGAAAETAVLKYLSLVYAVICTCIIAAGNVSADISEPDKVAVINYTAETVMCRDSRVALPKANSGTGRRRNAGKEKHVSDRITGALIDIEKRQPCGGLLRQAGSV